MSKLVFYIDSMEMGGANRVIANLVNHFSKLRDEVILINDVKSDNEQNVYSVDDTVKRYYLNTRNTNVFIKNIQRVLLIRKIIKKEKPDSCLSFLGPPNIRFLIASLGLKTRKIVSVRNDPNIEYGLGIKKYIICILFKFATGVVFQTQDASQYFGKSIRSKSTIILNPVNIKFFNTCRKELKKEILVIGRLQKQKNPGLALDAFIKVHDIFPDYKLVYIGDGELKESLQKRIAEVKLQNDVVFYGKVLNVEDYLKTAAVYILSSDYEGLPNALMEAMTVGVPVISTDCPCGGPKTLIRNSNEGILVQCNDPSALASAICKILSDKELQEKMCKYEKIRSMDFMPDKICSQWSDFLKADNL